MTILMKILFNVFELDAASNNSVDIRNLIDCGYASHHKREVQSIHY
jgi:DNA polymerase III gamma/tau subunit